MKKCLSLICVIFCIQIQAKVSTSLEVDSEPTRSDVKKAIKSLDAALNKGYYAKNLKKSRELISIKKVSKRIDAAVYANGIKQFNGQGDESLPRNFKNVCFKGGMNAAVQLINLAISLDYWNADSEWVDSAKKKNYKIELKFIDGPNEEVWFELISKCK
ncbi:MAG: hypothetical protein AB8E15_07075 [Bdellovibrionales bacterium]